MTNPREEALLTHPRRCRREGGTAWGRGRKGGREVELCLHRSSCTLSQEEGRHAKEEGREEGREEGEGNYDK